VFYQVTAKLEQDLLYNMEASIHIVIVGDDSQIVYSHAIQGQWKQPGDGTAKLSTIPRIMGTQASRGVWGHATEEIFEN